MPASSTALGPATEPETGAPPDATAEPSRGRLPIPRALARLARPHQWIKNGLVFAAPATAGVLTQGDVLLHTAIAFVAFSLVASGTYALNDVVDRIADSHHPVKRARPVASGLVSPTLAMVFGVALFAAGVTLVALTSSPLLVLVLMGYVTLTVGYSTVLKNVEVVDLVAVASGFLLRAVGGGVAADVPISSWFLIVASFGSIFLITGKRHAEHVDLGDARGEHRATLGRYSLAYLRQVRGITSAVAILAYCLWALERADTTAGPWSAISIVPFVLAMLRYELLIEEGRGGAPEEVFRWDRTIQVLGVLWVALVMAGIYAA